MERVVVVSPEDTGIANARAKTDKLDARALASLLGKGELEAVWMPDERCRILRRRLACRHQELEVIRSFLDRHPDQVFVIIVEDYVPPAAVAQAFAGAGLTRYTATLDRNAPLPTLGELIARGQRLVVFAEEKGGSPVWYMPAFSLIKDTPLGALHPGQLSCARYRGEQSSPLLLINHWISPFPPAPR